jgi:hypothetical protein
MNRFDIPSLQAQTETELAEARALRKAALKNLAAGEVLAQDAIDSLDKEIAAHEKNLARYAELLEVTAAAESVASRKSRHEKTQASIAESLARSGLQEELSGEAKRSAPKQKDQPFIYGAPTADAIVLSVVRLKYLPRIQDTGNGVQAERERAGRWKQVFTESFGPNIFSEKVNNFK